MHPKWLIGLFILYIAGAALSDIYEGTWFVHGEGGTMNALLTGWSFMDFSNSISGIVSFFHVAWIYIKAMFDIATFDWSFFSGSFEIVRWFFFALSIGFWGSVIMSRLGART